LSKLPQPNDPHLLVGYSTSDDAGVYRISDELALVQTVDFFTPIVDDPHTYGQIAAANSLSDVYAMGGKPLSALALVCFPEKGDISILEQILAGGLSKMAEAGCTVVGGHSVRDEEIKFGYAVTGLIHPQKVWTNAGARPGDRLLLTKPLGTGVITTALKKGEAQERWVAAAVRAMLELNRGAAEALAEQGEAVHAVTDVTGFGLLGHAREMAVASGVSLRIDSSQIEFLEGAREAAQAGHLAGGLKANREFLGECIQFRAAISSDIQNLLHDPQTSGGLLVAMSPDRATFTQQGLARHHCRGVVIGDVQPKTSPLINVN
jgi:selenide,water dikinase